MSSLIEPNIHPILVHFAFALSVTAAALYLASFIGPAKRWRETLAPAADWMLALGALAIIATVAAGFQAYYTVDHDTPSHAAMTTHRNWAVPSAIAILILAFWRWRSKSKPASGLFTGLIALAALSLTITAWWGGKIVYGYGLGVASLPTVTGDGHDHDHGAATGDTASPPIDHDEDAGGAQHDGTDGHHDADTVMPLVPESHDNSDGHHDDDGTSDAAIPAGSPAETAMAFHEAMRTGDEAALRSFILSDVVIAEGGGAERSLEEYAGHHMPADMAYISAIDTSIKVRDVIENGDMATVITESQMHGTYQDKTIHNRSMETMVLRRTDDGWRIAHIHWSSTPITGDHEH
jgi:uncharacterized membrane protein/ketosteroid isomerase-like protein